MNDADRYDKRWSAYLNATHTNAIQTLEDHLHNQDSLRLLDISTGSAKIYEHLAASNLTFDRIAFNDINPDAIPPGRREKIQDTFDNDVDFTSYEAKDLQYVNETFDVIISLNSYHLYPLKYNVFDEVDRILKHNGHFLVLDWNRDGWFTPIYNVIDAWTDETLHYESHNELIQRANKRWFTTVTCNTWSWRWWKFYTVLLKKYDNDFLNDTDIPDE